MARMEDQRANTAARLSSLPDQQGASGRVERRQHPREPELLPVREELDSEQAALGAWREGLRYLPHCLDPGQYRHCESAVASACRSGSLALAEQMLLFMSQHFSREDGVMRRGRGLATPHPQFDPHVEEHGTLIQELVDALVQPAPCACRDAMRLIVEERFPRHLSTHDEVLRRLLAG